MDQFKGINLGLKRLWICEENLQDCSEISRIGFRARISIRETGSNLDQR